MVAGHREFEAGLFGGDGVRDQSPGSGLFGHQGVADRCHAVPMPAQSGG